MALILNIETATNVCSVALARDGKTISLKENNEGQSHARVLTTLISECLSETGLNTTNLDAVAVSKGPGSYTGLRIGVASAKGLCFGLDIPLISVNTLQSMTFTYLSLNPELDNVLLCPMIDARRMEVYTALFNRDGTFFTETSAMILDQNSFMEILQFHRIIFFGDGMIKIKQLIGDHKNAAFIEQFEPSATGIVQFSEKSYKEGNFESTAYFEPFYLKDFYSPRQPSKD